MRQNHRELDMTLYGPHLDLRALYGLRDGSGLLQDHIRRGFELQRRTMKIGLYTMAEGLLVTATNDGK